MSVEFTPNLKLARVYKRVLIDFQQIWAIKRHFEMLACTIGDEELMFAPIDLNRIYGTLKVLHEMIQKTDSPTIVTRLESVAHDLVASYQWLSTLDNRITPYDLRIYIERAVDIDSAQMRMFAKYFLNKQNPTSDDLAKADYLLARAFSIVNEDGSIHINVENEDALEAALTKLLPRSWRKKRPANYPAAVSQLLEYIFKVHEIKSYDELIASNLIAAARQFKQELGENFYSAAVLAKCVILNVELRNRFERFCREEHARLKSFTLTLLNSDAELVQDSIDSRQHVSLSTAVEFSEQASDLISIDYNQTLPYLQSLSRVRDLMQRTVMLHGLDPHAGNTPMLVTEMVDVLKERTLEELGQVDDGLQTRLHMLNDKIRAIQSAPRPSAVKVMQLENTTLVLSSWEFDAFKPSPKDSYFARLSYDVLKRSVALIAEIQENVALYRLNEASPQLANSYLMKLNFFVVQAQKIAQELEEQSNSARERQEIDAACNLSATRQKLLDSYNKIKPLVGQNN